MCKLTYTQLKKMLDDANWSHDIYWELGLYNEALRYTYIAHRILQAICRIPAKNTFLLTGDLQPGEKGA